MAARLLPFYRTGGLLSGGGGGGPLGEATVWDPVLDWSALGTIAGPLRAGDRVRVDDLVPGVGFAEYDGTDWRLAQAVFPTVADLLAFAELINSGAIAIVGTGGDETDPAYYYTGSAWTRMPDEVHYIWTDRIDWADLATIADPQIDDEALVTTLGTTASSAKAQKHLNQWRLTEGNWATVADMTAWPVPGVQAVHNLAFARVKASGGSASDAVPYVYQSGAWVRYAGLTAGFVWTLSSLTDFSAVGLKDGDFGVLTQSGGDPVVVRYKAACTTAYASPIPAWISPEAYNATPVIQGYLIGSEDASARAAQGWTDILSAAGTRSITGNEGGSGETRLLGEYSGGQPGLAQLACGVGAMLAGTKVWWSAVIRGSTTGSISEAAVRFAGDGTNFNWLQQRNASGTLRMTDGSNTAIDSNQIPGGTGSALPGVASTPDLFVGFDTGSTGVSRVTRKGSAYSAARRPAAASVQNNALRFSAQAGASSSQGVLRVSYVIVVTY